MKCFILSSNVQYTQKLYMRYKTNTGLPATKLNFYQETQAELI